MKVQDVHHSGHNLDNRDCNSGSHYYNGLIKNENIIYFIGCS